jgi:hypothetical protein
MAWDGVCEIEKLPVVPLSEESPIRNQLVERGKKFVKYAIGPHYLQCTGNMFRNIWFGTTNFKSEGRVMIDTVSFAKINPNYNMGTARANNSSHSGFGFGFGGFGGFGTQVNKNNEKSIKKEEFFMCVPSLFGFSFTAKKWGELYIDDLNGIVKLPSQRSIGRPFLSVHLFLCFFCIIFLTIFPILDISFDDGAFDQLVMDPIKKDLISSLVMSNHKGVDLISGKGGGCIFLLHGPPGGLLFLNV